MGNLNDIHAGKIKEAEAAVRKILFDLEDATGGEIFCVEVDPDNRVSIILDEDA